MTQLKDLKSLAHPEWPYEGTVHEWRGFVKGEKSGIMKAADTAAAKVRTWSASKQEYARRVTEPVYQKQNLGPELT